ncbi:MAG TPA: hypothetical protein VF575_04595 [Candidatus Saccharimonadales bacterium]|jgi:hypothetical protein
MTLRHENPIEPPDCPLRDPAEHRRDALIDGGGFPQYLADALIEGDFPQYRTPTPMIDRPPRVPHLSRRGGRAFPEIPDSAADLSWNAPRIELTPEQQVMLARGAAAVRDVVAGKARLDAAGDPDEYRHLLALQRAHRERHHQ